MKNKPLYELNLPPAAFFIGQHVRVHTRLEERDEFGETVGGIIVVGIVVESDSLYLTLGTFSDLEGTPVPHLAVKHEDIQMIRVINEDDLEIETLHNKPDTIN